MLKYLLPFIFVTFSLFPINCIYKGERLTLKEQFEIEDLANQIVNQNRELIMNLFGFSSVSGGVKCEVCSFAVDVFKNFLLQKKGFEKFYALVKQICHFTKLDDRVCDGAIDHYKDIVVDAVLRRFLNGDYICTLLKICTDTTEYETIDDYAKKILGDKPETKEREIVQRKNDDNYYKVLQVTDIHLDMEYKEGTVANCNLPLCCRELRDDDLVPVKQILAGFYGTTGKCDANIETVKAFASKAKELNPDYIMFTGDNIAHSVWLVTQEEVIKATRIQIEAIQEKFGMDTPIYPAIGNHERAPVDEFHGEESELLYGLADIFKPYLTKEAYETFRKFGYYSMIVKDNLRIVSINCLLCDSMNFYHSHSEYLSMIHEYYNETTPTHVNYICSGLTTYSEYQPSFRIYLVDKEELYVQDYIQYRMNLIESNEKREPVWFIPYNATDLFNVTSLNDIDAMASYKITPEYIQHKYTDVPGSEDRGKDEGTRHNAQCVYDHDNMEDVFNCTGVSMFSSNYLYYIFNKISFQWEK